MAEITWIEKVAKRHKEWVGIIHKFGEFDYERYRSRNIHSFNEVCR